ncbi:MAG: TonB-dependent receptor, partial [Sphingomicrobium sp.]
MTSPTLRRILLAGTALIVAVPAFAQDAPTPEQPPTAQSATPAPAPPPSSGEEADEEEIVVVGQRPRGSVIGDISPENTLTGRDVRATGATSITELLEALAPQLGSARGRGGERPILLLNGQRISSFRELRDIPTEAIQRVEILPEEVALKYGYRADQRVVNFILRERFRSTAVQLRAGTATEGGQASGLADVTRLMLDRNGRTTINLHAEGNSALTESERAIFLQPIAGRPDLDPRDARTLVGSKRDLRATVTHNRKILDDVSGTFSGEVEHSQGKSLLGFPLPSDGSPPIGVIDPRVRDTSADSAHAGLALNWDKEKWRWSATGNADLSRNVTSSDPNEPPASRDRSRSNRASG